MKIPVILLAALLTAVQSQAQSVKALPYCYDPALSPDGREVVFVSGGDIWTMSSSGGEARLLSAHPAMETRPLYSPDGRYIAFQSTRSGNGDLYTLDMTSGKVTRITFDDAAEELNNWSPDGKYLYYSTTGGDIAGMRDIYKVNATGGTPMSV
ncbi:MAG: peptidase S41, partial [Sphingobacteriales bacterium]